MKSKVISMYYGQKITTFFPLTNLFHSIVNARVRCNNTLNEIKETVIKESL